MFQRGETMTTEEVSAIFSLPDINKDGKLNYSEVSFYYLVTQLTWRRSYILFFSYC